MALYNYAHLPGVFKPQRRIRRGRLAAAPEVKLQLLSLRSTRLNDAGYVYIGMDHLPSRDDDLAVAQRQGRLHRNFPGLFHPRRLRSASDWACRRSGRSGRPTARTCKTLEEYYDRLDHGIAAGHARHRSSPRTTWCGARVIQCLMCQFEMPIESIEIAHLIDFKKYFAQRDGGSGPFPRGGPDHDG